MTQGIKLSPEATHDRERLADFLVEKNPTAALRSIEAIVKAIARLSRFPFMGSEIAVGRRELKVPFGKAGYVVQYRIEPDAIVIARIFHMREDR